MTIGRTDLFKSDKARSSAELIGLARTFFFTCFCVLMPYTIAYSQICLASALALYLYDALVSRRITTSKTDWQFYLLCIAYVLLGAVSGIVNSTALSTLAVLKEEWLFLVIPLTVYMVGETSRRDLLWSSILISVSAVAIYGWLQHFWGVNLRSDYPLYQAPAGFYRAWGNFHNTLTYGNLFATLGLFFGAGAILQKKRSWTIGFAITGALAGGAGLFSYSRGPMVGIAVGLFVALLFLFRRSKKYALTLGSLALLLIVALSPGALERFKSGLAMELGQYETVREKSSSRLTIWSTSLEIVSNNPVFGVGPGNFEQAYSDYADPSLVRTFSHAHNDVLNIAAYAGLPAALVFLALWIYLFHRLWRVLWNRHEKGFAQALALGALAGSVTFFVCSMTEAAFADEEVRVGLMFIWGIGLWAANSLDSERISSQLPSHPKS